MGAAQVRDRERHRQTMESLASANRIRLAQAKLKREIEAGKTTVCEALTDDRLSGNLTMIDLLRWQVRWGARRAERLCVKLDISPHKAVRTLTDRQRALVRMAFGSDGFP